jgi:predicted nucleotidyltransferase
VIAQADVDAVVERIAALYDPERIYVFGSYAKGNATDRSDLDLLVVKPTNLPRSLRGRDVVAVLSRMAFSMDVLFYTPEEVEAELTQPYSLISTVMPTAKLAYRSPTLQSRHAVKNDGNLMINGGGE